MATALSDAGVLQKDSHEPEVEGGECCWICLGESSDELGPLVRPCTCPRYTHRSCLAHWQLVSAGKDEETRCRFCNQLLPDWRPALTPSALQPKPSVMSVRYRGVTHRIQYTPGPDGLDAFLQTLQSIGIKVASASQVTFLCRAPTGEELSLKGLKAFDAAAYCASITAAKRLARSAGRRARAAGAAAATAGDAGAPTDLGVHAAHPDSPTAAAAASLRCAEPAVGSAGEGEAPTPAAAAAASPGLRQRVVAHVHAEAFHPEIEGSDGAASPAAGHGPDAGQGEQPAAAPQPPRVARPTLAAVAVSAPCAVLRLPLALAAALRRAAFAPRGRQQRLRQQRRAGCGGLSGVWGMVMSLLTLLLGPRRHQPRR